jgi:hypothetical protein
MAIVPKLDRLTRMDTGPNADPIRQAAIWQELCEKIEDAFSEVVDLIAFTSTKNSIFVANTAPTPNGIGDLWLDSDDGNKPYSATGLTSGDWLAVQDIGAALALGSINLDGTIANDKVVNASVLTGAVIGTNAGYTAGTTNIASGSYTWTQVASQSFTSAGGQVRIACAALINVIDNCKYKFRLKCDTAVLGDEVGPITVSTSDQVPLAFTWAHTPASGAHTYTLEVAVNDAGDIDVVNPLIDPFENRNL